MGQQVLTTADLIFPEASGNFSQTLSSLKRARLSIKNRLSSILYDAAYVETIGLAYSLPLVANERCGSWYIRPEAKAGSVYFKSTDGHQRQWKFSTRRLNLQLLDLIGKHGGCVIVDSTRRGKLMPDALSKTIPVWCAVMNRFLFPELSKYHGLVLSEQMVSISEAAQISSKLDTFLRDLQALNLDADGLRASVKRPLRPYFMAPELPMLAAIEEETSPVVCCSASRREGGDNDEYVQGAGDDNEHWSRGLTADIFWQHQALFRPDQSDSVMVDTIDRIVGQMVKAKISEGARTLFEVNTPSHRIEICGLDNLQSSIRNANASPLEERPYDLLVTCDLGLQAPDAPKLATRTIHLNCLAGKSGSRNLRHELLKIEPALEAAALKPNFRALVAGAEVQDLTVGIVLAMACRLEHQSVTGVFIDKAFIRQRLAAITAGYPQANPSRATLQSVNAHLMQVSKGDAI